MNAIPLSLYIHVPWCIRKCPYCDFNSHQAPSSLDEAAYVHALLTDLESELPHVWGRRLHSIFIGGGTPSLLSAQSFETLLSGIRSLIPFRPNIEVTLEANPGTFEQERFKGFREAGINRLSIGIQSFKPEHLHALGRVHSQAEALKAAEIARYAGFDNFNLDLMFALPQQTIEQAIADLEQAIRLKPTHLSWYQLTLEPNTLFHKYPPVVPHEDLIAEMQLAGQKHLLHSCYTQYEVSAYAQSNKQCLHNRNYWEFGDYLAIGAGAHGKITQTAQQNITRYQKYRQPEQYLQFAQQGKARSHSQVLEQEDLAFEFMLNALRLKTGINLDLFSERTFLPIQTLEAPIEQGIQQGLLKLENNVLSSTDQGWNFLNEALQLFLKE